MYNEYLSYDLKSKISTIYTNNKLIAQYPIGECFIDFLELNFDEYERFSVDLNGLFSYASSSPLQHKRKTATSSNANNVIRFFKKYPFLKKEFFQRIWKIADAMYETNFDFNSDTYCEPFIEESNEKHLSDRLSEEEINTPLMQERLHATMSYMLNNVTLLSEFTWSLIFDYSNPYISNLDNIVKHPYMQLSKNKYNDFNIGRVLKPHILKKCYCEAFIFCFDIDFNQSLNLLSAKERQYLYNKLRPRNQVMHNTIESEYTHHQNGKPVMPDELYDVDDIEVADSSFSWFNTESADNLCNQIKNMDIEQHQLFLTNSLENIMSIEFQKMIEIDAKAKKCKNCGRYFLLKGGYQTDYCDRIPKGKNHTCKKLGAINARKKKIGENVILKEFEKAYKRNYARVSNKKISQDEFRLWMDSATIKRDQLVKQYNDAPPNNVLLKFKNYLGNK